MRATILVVSILLADAANAAQQTPLEIPYRGVLERDGAPYDGDPVAMRFAIFDADTAGNELWYQVDTAVPVTDGKFSVSLSDIPVHVVRDNAELFLGVEVAGVPLTHRQKLLAVPYARRSDDGVPTGSVVFIDPVACPEESEECPDGSTCVFGTDTCTGATLCPPGWSAYAAAAGRAIVGETEESNPPAVPEVVLSPLTRGAQVTHQHAYNSGATTDYGVLANEVCDSGEIYCPGGEPASPEVPLTCDPNATCNFNGDDDYNDFTCADTGSCGYYSICSAATSCVVDAGPTHLGAGRVPYFLDRLRVYSANFATIGYAHSHGVPDVEPTVAHLPYLQLQACRKN